MSDNWEPSGADVLHVEAKDEPTHDGRFVAASHHDAGQGLEPQHVRVVEHAPARAAFSAETTGGCWRSTL
jgi:hypothetical protein